MKSAWLVRALVIVLSVAYAILIIAVVKNSTSDAQVLTIDLILLPALFISAATIRFPSWRNLLCRSAGLVGGFIATKLAADSLDRGDCGSDGLCPLQIFNGVFADIGLTAGALLLIYGVPQLIKRYRERQRGRLKVLSHRVNRQAIRKYLATETGRLRAAVFGLTVVWSAGAVFIIVRTDRYDADEFAVLGSLIVGLPLSMASWFYATRRNLFIRGAGLIASLIALYLAPSAAGAYGCGPDGPCSIEMLNGPVWDFGTCLVLRAVFELIGAFKGRSRNSH